MRCLALYYLEQSQDANQATGSGAFRENGGPLSGLILPEVNRTNLCLTPAWSIIARRCVYSYMGLFSQARMLIRSGWTSSYLNNIQIEKWGECYLTTKKYGMYFVGNANTSDLVYSDGTKLHWSVSWSLHRFDRKGIADVKTLFVIGTKFFLKIVRLSKTFDQRDSRSPTCHRMDSTSIRGYLTLHT